MNMTDISLPLSIRTEGNDIEIVNQLLLPHVVEYIPINSIGDAHDAIKTMKVSLKYSIDTMESLTKSFILLLDSRRTCHRISSCACSCIRSFASTLSVTSSTFPVICVRASSVPTTSTRFFIHGSANGGQPWRSYK